MSDTFIGIDVSKSTLDVALRPSGETHTFSNDEPGIARCVQLAIEHGPTTIVLESTGGAETAIVASLAAASLPVVSAGVKLTHPAG